MTTISKRTGNLIRGTMLLVLLIGWVAVPRLLDRRFEQTALAAPMTFVVNTTADSDDGVCSAAASGCTLREAINAANSNPGPDTINFDIPGAGVKTIHLTSNLPFVGPGVTIDGYTQGLATPNTLAVGDNALLLIELDASGAVNPNPNVLSIGLSVGGGGSIVRGLVINGYSTEGIRLSNPDNTIEGNFIGTDPTGAIDLSSGTGVGIDSSNNTIGGTAPAARNLISGNSTAISIKNSSGSGNQVLNNYIGTDSFGTSPIPNGLGVIIVGASNNTIGGTSAGSGNLIAFNTSSGIAIAQSATGNNISGNSIHSNGSLGIDLGAGGITPNDAGDGDTGDNNLQNFPVLTSASSAAANTTIHGTLNSTPGTQFRVEIFSSPSCDDSGNGEGKKLIDSGNLVTNAGGDLSFASVVPTASLAGPYITATATDPSNNTSEFSKCIPALAATLVVNSTADTDDGACTVASGGCTLREAINLANSDSLLNSINFNIPGSGVRTISPTSALPTITAPVIIDGYTQLGSSPNTLANGDDAVLLIELNGAGASNATGLALNGGNSVVRGLAINRFEYGIISDSGDNVVAGNFVGTNPTGASGLGNTQAGIRINSASGNRIGALLPADRNVISGNSGTGVVLITTNANVVLGNYIGTNPSGTAALGNNFGLIIAAASSNIVRGNLISGNTAGIWINLSTSNGNTLRANHVGTDVSLSKPLGNTGAGISIENGASDNRIDNANIIAFNGGDGVSIASGTANTVTDNSVYSNGGLGIDLVANGVTPNDVNDLDSGANNLQNFPIVTSVVANGPVLKAAGTLDSIPFTKYTIRFFSNSSCDPSGNGEGEIFITAQFVTTDVNGSADFSLTLSPSLSGRFITATATDSAGNTSEFSPCAQIPFVSNFQFGTPSISVVEDCKEVIVDVSRLGDTTLPASVDYSSQSGTASDRSDFTTAVGTLHFAPGETAMSFSVPISEDSFIEGTETATLTLSNAVGAGLGSPTTATLQITDDQPEQSNNPVDVAEQFVCQHYQDFLNREHDVAGLNFWTNEIESCGADAECRGFKRINVSAAFFLSIEFQETGGNVIRTQRAAFGKKSETAASRLTYLQFLRDARQVGKGVIVGEPAWQQTLEDNKQAYAEQVVTSSLFVAQYPLNQSADTYVDALFASAGVVPSASERQEAINAFGAGGTAGRTAALRKVVDSQTLREAEFRPAFVLMQYFGYLRRNPTDPPDSNDNGYQFWLAKLNAFSGDFVKAEMVKAFIISGEYRNRFGP
jgi:CSLREA domain-containing protein